MEQTSGKSRDFCRQKSRSITVENKPWTQEMSVTIWRAGRQVKVAKAKFG
jgi:hypothetical protein